MDPLRATCPRERRSEVRNCGSSRSRSLLLARGSHSLRPLQSLECAAQAKAQYIPALAAKGGEIPPIHKHFGDPKVEQAAFNLKPGQLTSLLEMPDGTSASGSL